MKRRPTTQDISWFLDLKDNNQINLNPSYQRRSVWTRKDRIFFLDTIFNGYPCPAVFLHKTTNDAGKSTYHVVDGKQRLETIIMFAENRLTMPKDHPDAELAGHKFKTLSPEYRQKFWDYVLAVDMLDIVEQAVVDEVFDRLNRNSRKLERQELRHAKFDGWMISFCETQSEMPEWKQLGIATASRAKRMKDVQFISELFISSLDCEPKGFSQDSIDEHYALYDSPDEDTPDFNKDAFEEFFVRVRDYLIQMNRANSCVDNYAKNYMHFYTLWNFVSKHHDKNSPADLAERYNQFMDNVTKISRDQIIDRDIAEQDSPYMKYAANSVGANTELPQRNARLQAMESDILQ